MKYASRLIRGTVIPCVRDFATYVRLFRDGLIHLNSDSDIMHATGTYTKAWEKIIARSHVRILHLFNTLL